MARSLGAFDACNRISGRGVRAIAGSVAVLSGLSKGAFSLEQALSGSLFIGAGAILGAPKEPR